MSELIELTVANGIPTTTSLAIAERFGRLHTNVLRDIENLECSDEFSALNFEGCAYKGGNGKLLPMYAVTKDGFMFLAMGFTGKEAAAWKERYIAAFNAMESKLIEQAAAEQIPQPNGTLFLSHAADILVAADRSFRAAIRSGRSAGLGTANAIRRANEIARVRTGINMLSELQAHEHVAVMDAQPAATVEPVEVDVGGLQQFWAEYEGGGLAGGACIPLLSTQAYDIYKDWCGGANIDPLNLPRMVNGLRVAGLVRNVRKRFVNSRGVTHGPCAFLIPAGPLDMTPHLSETRWLGECVAQIDAAMAL